MNTVQLTAPRMNLILVVICFAVAVAEAQNSDILFGREFRSTRDYRLPTPCSGSMACQWAVCPWKRKVIVSPYVCRYIPNIHCECAEGTSCQKTNIMEIHPGSSVTYIFLCQ